MCHGASALFRQLVLFAHNSDLSVGVCLAGRLFFLQTGPVDVLGQGYVETETEWQLAGDILGGAWCLVVGHKQSGKSSTVAAAKEILRASGEHIQLMHISLQREYASSGEFWHFLADRMHAIDPFRFPLTDPAQLAADPLNLMWEWFYHCEGSTAVAIAIDEAARLGSIQDIVVLMAEWRALREAQNQLRSVVFVGIGSTCQADGQGKQRRT